MSDPMLRLAILRVVILLAALPMLALGTGCKQSPLPPPLVDGRCTAAAFDAHGPTEERCWWSGDIWRCSRVNRTCKVESMPAPPTAEAR